MVYKQPQWRVLAIDPEPGGDLDRHIHCEYHPHGLPNNPARVKPAEYDWVQLMVHAGVLEIWFAWGQKFETILSCHCQQAQVGH